jgi:dihydrofolate synthase/folylpolyglutamate synthase
MTLAPDLVGAMDDDVYVGVLDRIYDMPGHLTGRSEVFVPTPEQRLERIAVTRRFLDRAIPSWKEIHIVHIAGTSGKGSTAWMLAAMLAKQGRTGLVTSPHLFDLRERIRVDLKPISRDDLVRVYEEKVEANCRELVKEEEAFALRFPEVILACAFAHFLEVGVKWAVIETALGGRLDQSNVVQPRATAITNVSKDHMHQLGQHLVDIAAHKAGITKPGVPMYTTETRDSVLDVIRTEAERVVAPLHLVRPEIGHSDVLRLRGTDWRLAMRGSHQRTNAALALTIALDVATVPAEACAEALATAVMPARFQEVRPGVFADVAHNPAKMRALASTIDEVLAGRSTVLVVGITEKKDHPSILRPLTKVADGIVFTRSRYRGIDPSTLLMIWRELKDATSVAKVVDGPREAVETALRMTGEEGAVVVTGSTFVVDEALNPDRAVLEANATYVAPGEAYEGRNRA